MEHNIDQKIKAMASRIRELREIENISISEMAEKKRRADHNAQKRRSGTQKNGA